MSQPTVKSRPKAPQPVATVVPGFAAVTAARTVVDTGPCMPIPTEAPLLPSQEAELLSDYERYGEREEIGRGGMGCVYRVKDQDLNRNIAMKVLNRIARDRENMKRFVAEAQISGQLEHPSLLPIHDFGINGEGEAFFTMRYVPDHETLHDIIHRLRVGDPETHALYTMERRVQIIQRVCDALTYAHERGVIHRDIKPSNIILGDNGEIYLADWGVAYLLGEVAADGINTTIDEGPEDEGLVIGTPLYMSPEQLLGEGPITPKSDVFSLCAVAYELLSLEHYLGRGQESSYHAILESALHDKRKDAEDYLHPQNGRVPRQLSRILRMGLTLDRENAIASTRELNDALQRWLEGSAPIVCPGTFIQHLLGMWSRAIDRSPTLVPALSIGLAGLLLLSVVVSTLALASL